ncbi:Glycosyl Hydrolase Family 88 [Amycolatopsis xylanica]|uniref:Glycosyl Hydrolase Family 88 n=1 Tax=Amycolatopsis xylanica TaxID=589385 RepID=A0A1H3NEC8_9PSEU|nr:glycoside hydrolase family 88 protein [Amycolatopsis xylanica]SDY87267.1 Glycosyl Hydrolase Family 88 [Amycolatopsis xylanica]
MSVRIRALALALAAALTGGLATSAPAQADPVPADLCDVAQKMVSAGDYWVNNGTNLASNGWENATFHVGNLALVRTTGVSNHKTLPWAKANNYLLQTDAKKPFFPDFEAAGEAYLDLFTYFHPDAPIIADLRKRVADEVASVQQGHTKYWNYVDGLNMAMPSFARLGVLDNSPATLDAMQTLFHYTEKGVNGRGLFSEATGLWWRDGGYIGSNTFWSRGNGWAISALSKVLQVLPANDPRRPEYLRVFKKMAATLKAVQRSDGFWNSSLLNPYQYGGPESSGTAFFTYGIAYGINAGILDAATYKPVVDKGWTALSTKALQANGKLGYVQPVGSKPGPAKPDGTAAYGVGAFLLAGQQVAKLTPGCAPPA